MKELKLMQDPAVQQMAQESMMQMQMAMMQQ